MAAHWKKRQVCCQCSEEGETPPTFPSKAGALELLQGAFHAGCLLPVDPTL